jgi:hypothetical protein
MMIADENITIEGKAGMEIAWITQVGSSGAKDTILPPSMNIPPKGRPRDMDVQPL